MDTPRFTEEEIDSILRNTDFKDLRPFDANCASVAAGIARVIDVDGFPCIYDMDSKRTDFLHATVTIDESVFDARGKLGADESILLDYVRGDSHTSEVQSPMRADIQERLLSECVVVHTTAEDLPVYDSIAAEAASRIRKTITTKESRYGPLWR